MHTAQSAAAFPAASLLESNTDTGREDGMSGCSGSRSRLDALGEVAGDESVDDDSSSAPPGVDGPRFPEKNRQK